MPTSISRAVGQIFVITPHPLDGSGNPVSLSGHTVTHVSSDETIAPVTADGIGTARAVGAAVITTTVDGKTDTTTVTVVAVAVSAITLSPATLPLLILDTQLAAPTQQVTAAVTSTGTGTAAVTWRSTTPAVATVDASGLVTYVGAGTTNIIATAGGVDSAPLVLTVRTAGVASARWIPELDYLTPRVLSSSVQSITPSFSFAEGEVGPNDWRPAQKFRLWVVQGADGSFGSGGGSWGHTAGGSQSAKIGLQNAGYSAEFPGLQLSRIDDNGQGWFGGWQSISFAAGSGNSDWLLGKRMLWMAIRVKAAQVSDVGKQVRASIINTATEARLASSAPVTLSLTGQTVVCWYDADGLTGSLSIAGAVDFDGCQRPAMQVLVGNLGIQWGSVVPQRIGDNVFPSKLGLKGISVAQSPWYTETSEFWITPGRGLWAGGREINHIDRSDAPADLGRTNVTLLTATTPRVGDSDQFQQNGLMPRFSFMLGGTLQKNGMDLRDANMEATATGRYFDVGFTGALDPGSPATFSAYLQSTTEVSTTAQLVYQSDPAQPGYGMWTGRVKCTTSFAPATSGSLIITATAAGIVNIQRIFVARDDYWASSDAGRRKQRVPIYTPSGGPNRVGGGRVPRIAPQSALWQRSQGASVTIFRPSSDPYTWKAAGNGVGPAYGSLIDSGTPATGYNAYNISVGDVGLATPGLTIKFINDPSAHPTDDYHIVQVPITLGQMAAGKDFALGVRWQGRKVLDFYMGPVGGTMSWYTIGVGGVTENYFAGTTQTWDSDAQPYSMLQDRDDHASMVSDLRLHSHSTPGTLWTRTQVQDEVTLAVAALTAAGYPIA